MTQKTSISLTDAQAAFARSLVETGRYASLSAVIGQSLDQMRLKSEAEAAETDALRRLLAERAAGPFQSAEAFCGNLDALIAQKRADVGR